ncbi:unnamed protein product [Caenorhabditis bovis]|uniref:Glycosyltransferase family 92 protein n=1 Tax=Caenorhabditis bovis TaxID=2654633 RepID=A0A8S1FD45_9PELO|nr:unnamed protein product [Caenorhabditis bovis]
MIIRSLVITAKRYFRLIAFLFIVLFFAIVFGLLAGLTIFDRQHNHIIHDYVARNDDLIVLSTTYYENSKSFPENTAVILFNAVQVFHLKYAHLDVVAETLQGNVDVKFRIEPVIKQLPFYCKWVPYLAIGQVPDDHVLLNLSTNKQDGMELALRTPFHTPKKVVACFSPLFLNERWQLLLATVEIYSHYGAHLHFYVRSMITDLFAMIKENKNVRVTPWSNVRLGANRAASNQFDPNTELEFRNQASAMTDCLLLYKESATFVIFPDPDDIIIPSIARTYEEEFVKIFDMFPTAGAIAYNVTQSIVESTTSTSRYSPLGLMSSIKFEGEQRWGKLVVRPERVDSVWIHRAFGIRDGFEQVSLPVNINSVLHYRTWNFVEKTKRNISSMSDIPYYDPERVNATQRRVFTLSDGLKIERNFKKKIKKMYKVYHRLPTVSLYYPLIEECYNRIFYKASDMGSVCKGPEYCNIPMFPGMRCTNVASEFVTYNNYQNVFIHQLISSDFEDSENGCTL